MTKTAVPDRGDNPRRRVKYSAMMVEKSSPSGGYSITHYDDSNTRHNNFYLGYTKKQAMKRHKDQFEGN